MRFQDFSADIGDRDDWVRTKFGSRGLPCFGLGKLTALLSRRDLPHDLVLANGAHLGQRYRPLALHSEVSKTEEGGEGDD